MNRAEEARRILEDTLPRLEALGRNARDELDAAREEAAQNVDRHAEALEELGAVEERISRLTAERESLPNRAYRAGMDEDWAEEDRLKDLYRDIGREVGSLAERRDRLKEELARLAPRGTGDPRDATIEQYANVAGLAHGARAELEGLAETLREAADAMIKPVVTVHENTRSTVEQLGRERSWDQSPAGRGGVRA